MFNSLKQKKQDNQSDIHISRCSDSPSINILSDRPDSEQENHVPTAPRSGSGSGKVNRKRRFHMISTESDPSKQECRCGRLSHEQCDATQTKRMKKLHISSLTSPSQHTSDALFTSFDEDQTPARSNNRMTAFRRQRVLNPIHLSGKQSKTKHKSEQAQQSERDCDAESSAYTSVLAGADLL